jgi:geranylgeranyl reductase family protein
VIHDVIVIGAGPAGSICAYQLALQGYKVAILEKEQFPRYKPCGGGLSYKAYKNLPVKPPDETILEAFGGIVCYRGRQLLKIEVERPFAWLIDRPQFDDFLMDQARKAGAQVFEKYRLISARQDEQLIVLETDHGDFSAKYLIGADGINSTVARCFHLQENRLAGLAMEAELEVSDNTLRTQGPYATFDFGALPGGYGWIFPKRNHLSVGIFHARTGKAPTRQALIDFIKSHKLSDASISKMQAHHIPLGGRPESIHQGRVLLVGDAANLADPWIGEGMYYAITSANMAAETLAQSLQQNINLVADYEKSIQSQIIPQLQQVSQFARWVYAYPRLGSHMLSRSATMQQIVFGAIRGSHTYTDLNHILIQKLATILFQALTTFPRSTQ